MNTDLQRTLLEHLLADKTTFTRARSILEPEYFDREFQPAVRFVRDYADGYQELPDAGQISAKTGVHLTPPSALTEKKCAWTLDETEKFCQRRALEMAIYAGPDLIQQGDFGGLEALVKEAMQVSLQRNLGTAYYEDPKGRAQRLRDRNNMVSTGWKSLDEALFGGFNRGELNIFAGGSGSGKSLFLQNISRHWSEMGHSVIYISLELSEGLIAQRLDAMNVRIPTKMIWSQIDDVEFKIRRMGMKAGPLTIVQMPAGVNTHHVRAFLRDWEIQQGKKPDALVMDYLDLMHPNQKMDVSNLFVKDKYVSEEMRGLLQEENLLSATASQLNRSAVDVDDHNHAHISGGISKINTADNVATIYAPDAYKEKGKLRLQLIKTRSSSGVGKKIFLKYDPNCMVIEDFEPGEHPHDDSPDDVSIMEKVNSMGQRRQAIMNRPAQPQAAVTGDRLQSGQKLLNRARTI